MTKKPSAAKCLRCGREWSPRNAHPKRCPGCQSLAWNVPPEKAEAAPSPPVDEEIPIKHMTIDEVPCAEPSVIEQLEFDPEWAYKKVKRWAGPKKTSERKSREKRFSESFPEGFGVISSILPKAPLLLLLIVLMYDALTSLSRGDMWFVMDWYEATWVLPKLVYVFMYPGGPGEWFKMFWPLVVLLVMLLVSLLFVTWSLPYRFVFKDYVIIRGNVKVRDARVMWSTDNMWTRVWDRVYRTPSRDKVELWLKHRFFWNPLLPDKGLVKLTLDRAIEKPEQDGPFTIIAYERRYRKFVALNEMVTTDDGQQSREIPLDQANSRFNERGKLLVWDTQRFSLANPDVRIEKLKRGTHIVPQELKEAADVARKARQEN